MKEVDRMYPSECRNGESLLIDARRTLLLMGQGIKTSVWCDCNIRTQLPTKFSQFVCGLSLDCCARYHMAIQGL